MDRLFGEIDKAIKVLTTSPPSSRAVPAAPEVDALPEVVRARSVRLMRVNHSGEVAAQALYQGQAMTTRDAGVSAALRNAAQEEGDHLAWCAQRLRELNGRTSVFNPLWYAGSFAIGALAGVLGRGVGMGFVAETEKQVESHLRGHMERLGKLDERSRAILEQMTHDEMQHGAQAGLMGGKPLPFAVGAAMRMTSRLMTEGSYWL